MELPYPVILLKPGKEKTILQKHHWIFSGAIAKEPSDLKEGSLVTVYSSDKKFLAAGHFHKGTITVRCLTFIERLIDQEFWNEKITSAFQYRLNCNIIREDNNVFRLIHGEGDGLPGLVIDIYGKTAVVQTYTAGMNAAKKEIVNALLNLHSLGITNIYDKSAETMNKHGIADISDSYLHKSENHIDEKFVIENGYRFKIDYESGQKTGFFIDQRENRMLVKDYSNGKSVLNTFCYTGGFSVYALGGNAASVDSVDSSSKAMHQTDINISLNFQDNRHTSHIMDVMSFLKRSEGKYDLIILDPPAFAKHQSQVKNAMQGYRSLNTEGLKKLNPGGMLFTFSCSQAVDTELFRKLLFQSALQAGRNIRIMHHLHQPADHPVSIYHPEAEYLKGFVLFAE